VEGAAVLSLGVVSKLGLAVVAGLAVVEGLAVVAGLDVVAGLAVVAGLGVDLVVKAGLSVVTSSRSEKPIHFKMECTVCTSIHLVNFKGTVA